ncbi:MAG: hypothetical protein AAF092_16730 [Pseudomonadota bacterium]
MTDLLTLSEKLGDAWQWIQETDPPGSLDADVPAMVLADLAKLAIDQREGFSPEIDAQTLLTEVARSLAYMLNRMAWDASEADGLRISAAVTALLAIHDARHMN